jgi:hypothetical protein
MIRAKFKVDRVLTHEGQGKTLIMSASNQTDGDNKDWSQWTPSGELRMFITNGAMFPHLDALKSGDHFWLDLSPIASVPAGN